MKRILITGCDSYIGTNFEKYLNSFSNGYKVDTVDMRYSSWREKDFSIYDAVFHVAGIAHNDISSVSDEQITLYKTVNTDLAIETANKAKTSGVSQFVFMSSVIVYGESAPIGVEKIITADTVPTPSNFYGQSKLDAEKGMLPLSDDTFKVAVIRPPMIYGKECKGNYKALSKFAKTTPIFPNITNSRSMLYIGNLMEFIKQIIDLELSGIFFPSNREKTSTAQMVKAIAASKGKIVYLIKGFTWAFKLASRFFPVFNKVFGNLSYEDALTQYPFNYQIYSLEESIKETENQ